MCKDSENEVPSGLHLASCPECGKNMMYVGQKPPDKKDVPKCVDCTKKENQ